MILKISNGAVIIDDLRSARIDKNNTLKLWFKNGDSQEVKFDSIENSLKALEVIYSSYDESEVSE